MLLIFVRCAGRGDSAICTAPPPMIAPPQAQAHNLAKAIRTDIFDTLFVLRGDQVPPVTHPIRSEEHTSELQSLMRISYAVFCLKKKKHKISRKVKTSHKTVIS